MTETDQDVQDSGLVKNRLQRQQAKEAMDS